MTHAGRRGGPDTKVLWTIASERRMLVSCGDSGRFVRVWNYRRIGGSMLAQRTHDRRRLLGMAALSLAAAWIGTRDSVLRFEIEFLDSGVVAFAFTFG